MWTTGQTAELGHRDGPARHLQRRSALEDAEEDELVRQTAVYLAERQPVEDFPPMLDLLEVDDQL